MRDGLPNGHGLPPEVLGIEVLLPSASGTPLLTDIQFDALAHGIANGQSAVVSAPTSTGKTLIGLWTIAMSILDGRRAVYLVSHRALARQKFEELNSVFGRTILADAASSLVIATGDGVEDAAGRRIANPLESRVLVATYEKFLHCLAVNGPPRDLSDLCLVCDEIQLISDETRGSNVELLLTLLRRSGWNQFVGLSAVLAQADAAELSDWLGVYSLRNPRREKQLCIECRTPLGTLTTVADPERGVEPLSENTNRRPLETLQIVREMMRDADRRPVIVFCMRIDDTYDLARNWINTLQEIPIPLARPPGAEVSQELLAALAKRAAYHNAELTEDERELVEARLQSGLVDVVFSTSTLAAGVNFPLGSAVFHAWKRYDFNRRIHMPLGRADFQNMAGRVGRMGQAASQGLVTLVATADDRRAAARLMDLEAQDALISRIGPEDFGQLILHIFAGGLCNTREAAYEIIAGTLSASRELSRNRAGLAGWRERVDAEIDGLIEQECLIAGRTLVATLFGIAVAKTGLKPATANWFLSELFARADFLRSLLPTAEAAGEEDGLAFILCHGATTCPEYDYTGGRPSRFFHWRLDHGLAPNALAHRYSGNLFTQPWAANVAGANAALLTAAWASGMPRVEIERLVQNVRLGTIQAHARDIAWILSGVAEIIGRITAPSLDQEALPRAVRGDPNRLLSLRALARTIRRHSLRISLGLPADVLWMNQLEQAGPRPRLTRSEIVALRGAGLITPEQLMRGDEDANEGRRAALMTVGTIDGGASARLRDATRSWKLRERGHCRRIHERRTANVDGGDLVRRLYTIRGTPLEDVIAEAFARMGLPLTKLDDGSHPGRPDFMVDVGGAVPLIIEVKSRASDEQFIGLAGATEVLAASELMGHGAANCLTICSPAVDPSVPRLIEACGRLCVVDVSDLTDAIVRVLRQEMTVDAVMNWLTAPGLAVMSDLAPAEA